MSSRHVLALSAVSGVGSQMLCQLINLFGSAEAVCKADLGQLMGRGNLPRKKALRILNHTDFAFADDQLEKAEKKGASLISIMDDTYPSLLKQIPNPPLFLFVLGDMRLLAQQAVAIVGMRMPSHYGETMARNLAAQLAEQGLVIVSGMARGIDSQAHWSALDAGGTTVAVLGTGVDVVYPPENVKLHGAIAESGCVLSEFPLGTEPQRNHFPRRNRIISGLSLGTVVVEAGQRSGALITAYQALEQDREVFAVPGRADSAKSRGCLQLIKEGAKLVETSGDILEELSFHFSPKPQASTVSAINLSEDESALWEHLSETPVHIDSLTEKSGMPPSKVMAVLLSMELKNRVRQLSGMHFVRQNQ